MGKLLEVILEKAVDVLGDKAGILLDAKSREKRAAFELFHALRDFDDVLAQIPQLLDDAELENKLRRKELQRHSLDNTQDIRHRKFIHAVPDRLLAISNALENLNNAFHKADVSLEIYGSRELRDWVQQAIGDEVGLAPYCFAEMFDTPLERKKRTQARLKLEKLTKTARQKIAQYIKTNYPAS